MAIFRVGYLATAETIIALDDESTVSLDASQGNIFTLSAGGNRTISAPTNPITGQQIIIRVYASGGSRIIYLDTGIGGFRYGADITELTETTSGTTDYIGAIYNADDNKWDVISYSKGYGPATSAAIARDATSSGSTGSDTSLTFSHTCSGANGILWLGIRVSSDYTEDWIDTVTYNGVAMDLADKCLADNGTSGQAIYLYYLVDPPAGAHDIVITTTETTTIVAGSSSYTGAAQTGQPDSHGFATADATTGVTLNLTTTADNCWTVGIVDNSGATITSTSPSTVLSMSGACQILDSNGPISPAGSTALSASAGSNAGWTLVGASFKPAV